MRRAVAGWGRGETARSLPCQAAASVTHVSCGCDDLWHLAIDNPQFSATVDMLCLGERGLVEFVKLHSGHNAQPIFYRPLRESPHPWQREATARD